MHAAHFPGPATLISGNASPEELQIAASLCVLYSDAPRNQPVRVNVFRDKEILPVIETRAEEKDRAARWII
jgi:predicted ribosome quality control (RQC) complex YloA/Tae2 family protein